MSNPTTEGGLLLRGRRWLTVFAVLALSATLLAACGGSDKKDKTPTAAATKPAATVATGAGTPKAGSPVASPKAGSPTAGSPVAGTPKAGSPVASPSS